MGTIPARLPPTKYNLILPVSVQSCQILLQFGQRIPGQSQLADYILGHLKDIKGKRLTLVNIHTVLGFPFPLFNFVLLMNDNPSKTKL